MFTGPETPCIFQQLNLQLRKEVDLPNFRDEGETYFGTPITRTTKLEIHTPVY